MPSRPNVGATLASPFSAILLLVVVAMGCGGGGGDGEEPGLAVGDPAWLATMEPASFDASWARPIEQAETPGYFADVAGELLRLLAFWEREDAEHFVDRPRTTLTRFFPLVNLGDPWRNELRWSGGVHQRVYFLNRWGAKLTGDLWGPPDLFTSPGSTGGAARRAAVVITDGSLQGNARMYWWAAQALAEAGYVVLTYDVQGQGESETWGHAPDGERLCGVTQPPDTPPFLREASDCPGVPFQQSANFGVGAMDAHDWMVSTPGSPHAHFQDGTGTSAFNPWHAHVDPERVGAAGHSLGASAVSFVQGVPELLRVPVRAIVAWDSLSACSAYTREGCPPEGLIRAEAPALDLSSDYFFPARVDEMPDPTAARRAFESWRDQGREVMSIVLAGGTHLEYTSGPFHMATRHGQELATHYTQAFFDRHLRDDPTARERLLAREIEVLHRDPLGVPDAEPTRLRVRDFTSFLSYSAVSLDGTCYRDWKYRRDPC